ncbi:MAG: 23S rRNA (adenine(2030)-N(6))-methyltransferase RlmJ [Gammaproteobacteria bacterium]|nr:23S rRNA (adenine(2030)-N(6))-methyltransferase RlmJ [Gammaproteobacteria bacterium]
MLSYRHGFHAGNHADVLKHVVLTLVIDYLCQKPKPLLYLDTHAGAGRYDLNSAWAKKNAEAESGVARLWGLSDPPAGLDRYLQIIRDMNPDGSLRWYPGSPLLAKRLLRAEDRLHLYELHPAETERLEQCFGREKGVHISEADGFHALSSELPPKERRGLVLIDPPYEVKEDYRRVSDALEQAHRRFSNGVYLLWYPVLQRDWISPMLKRVAKIGFESLLRVELTVASARYTGMRGSGVVVINPPWTLQESLVGILPTLLEKLRIEEGGAYIVEPLK